MRKEESPVTEVAVHASRCFGIEGLALMKLRQALEAHEKRLDSAQQLKSGRNALVAAQRKRIKLIQGLIAACEQGMIGQKNTHFPFGNERG